MREDKLGDGALREKYFLLFIYLGSKYKFVKNLFQILEYFFLGSDLKYVSFFSLSNLNRWILAWSWLFHFDINTCISALKLENISK